MTFPDNIPGVAIAPMDRVRHALRTRPDDIQLRRAYVDALFAMTDLMKLVEPQTPNPQNHDPEN